MFGRFVLSLDLCCGHHPRHEDTLKYGQNVQNRFRIGVHVLPLLLYACILCTLKTSIFSFAPAHVLPPLSIILHQCLVAPVCWLYGLRFLVSFIFSFVDISNGGVPVCCFSSPYASSEHTKHI